MIHRRPPIVKILGTLEVTGPAGVAMFSGGRRRALVALLAVNAAKVVSQARLVDGLWGDEPPRTALRSLHSHVARVRQTLARCGLAGVLRSQEPGYVLAIDPSEVDAIRFEQLVKRAQGQLADGAIAEGAATLQSGLELWRGDAFADCIVHEWGEAVITRLTQTRLTMTEELWEARLQLAGHVEAVAELQALVAAHPTRERLHGLLMLALYRSGRAEEALEHYRELRRMLCDEFGMDPGRRLQELYTAVLRRDSALSVDEPSRDINVRALGSRPLQMPPDVGHFLGRDAQLAQLDDARPSVVVICGAAGIGKTALITRWALGQHSRFRNGQIFVDVRGHDPAAALTGAQVLAHVLRALGVSAEHLPADVAERSALMRTLLHDRAVLIVLDNAGSLEQILPIVPSSPSSLVVVTSRHRLSGLGTRLSVRTLELDVLAPSDAIGLLDTVLQAGGRRVGPSELAQLSTLCGGMPLALRIAAAKLTEHPRLPASDLIAQLRQTSLDTLAVEGDSRSVRTVFASAFQTLPDREAKLFCALGLHPGTSFGPHLAAALSEVDLEQARLGLEALAAAYFIVPAGPQRYAFHDLIRLYAQELTEPDGNRAVLGQRLVDWYLATTHTAGLVLEPGRDWIKPDVASRVEPPFAQETAAVMSYLDQERANLVAIAAFSAQHGHTAATWQLAFFVGTFQHLRGHVHDRVVMGELAVNAAAASGDAGVESLARSGLGRAYIAARRFDEALEQFGLALELLEISGDRRVEGYVHNNMAMVYTKQRRYPEAAAAFRRAIVVHTAAEHRRGLPYSLNNLGHVYSLMDDHSNALECLNRALAMLRDDGEPRLEAVLFRTLGNAHLRAGEHAEALRCLQLALDRKRGGGADPTTAEVLGELAMVHLETSRFVEALELAREAAQLSNSLDSQHLESLSVQLEGRAQLGLGDPVRAVERFETALKLRQQAPDAFEEAVIRQQLAMAQEAGRRPASDTNQPSNS